MIAPGAKAATLLRLQDEGYRIPEFCVVDAAWMCEHLARAQLEGEPTPNWRQLVRDAAVSDALRLWLTEHVPDGERFAVRSSAIVEDGRDDSFAGQFGTQLNVTREGLICAIREVWASAFEPHVLDYAATRGVDSNVLTMGVIVQRMLNAEVSGVTFAVDPVGGRRDLSIVSAVYGLGEGLVSGELDADRYEVDTNGAIVATLASKKRRCVACADGATMIEVVPVPQRDRACLEPSEILELVRWARSLSEQMEAWQDVEWCLLKGELWLLQSRPITGLQHTADPTTALSLWDNSNIIESYSGVTTPLTFSFVQYVYSQVYPQFFRFMGVEQSLLERNRDIFQMVGLIRGRIYYNLLNWYRALSLLPGYAVNAHFMEQMMGVTDGLDVPPPTVPVSGNRWWRLIKSIGGVARSWYSLPRRVREFHALVDVTLADFSSARLDGLELHALVTRYRALESELLTEWQTPLVNDFFAMVFFGVLRKMLTSWCPALEDEFQNQLLCAEQNIISTEPIERLNELVGLCLEAPELVDLARRRDAKGFLSALADHPEIATPFEALRSRFGARTLEELKLETVTAIQDPTILAAQLIAYLNAAPAKTQPFSSEQHRHDAETRFADALAANPLKLWIAGWVLGHTRRLVAQRENLRFERTRVFDAARGLFLAIGRQLAFDNVLGRTRDVFWLTKDEIFDFVRGTAVDTDLKNIIATRREIWAAYPEANVADRFATHGSPYVGNAFDLEIEDRHEIGPQLDGPQLKGTGCCAGRVTAQVLVVTDPSSVTDLAGRILVAERTDPGWTPLFPLAVGILVERGSLLSHSAIVARELGIPAVVAARGLLSQVRTGDVVTFDGSTGEITIDYRAAELAEVQA